MYNLWEVCLIVRESYKLTERTLIRSNAIYATRRDEKNVYIFLNKQITEVFTYQDLQSLIYETATDRGTAFKINLGFGLMLYHLDNQEFKYFYVSSNNLLFDVAYTISKRSNVNALMKKIIDLDVIRHYYMKRPSSGWAIVGMPNVEIKIFYLNNVLLG